MSNIIVIYHGGCADGFCAAWLFHRMYPDAEYIPARYGDVPPDVTGRDVFIVDFSFSRDLLLKMKEQAKSLVVLDHHKTAQADLDGLDFCVFDMTKSGARLAWEHLYDQNMKDRVKNTFFLGERFRDRPPFLVSYTEDRDLWKWELQYSRAFNATLRTHEFNFGVWDMLDMAPLSYFFDSGGAILRYQAMTVKSKVEQSHLVIVEYEQNLSTQSHLATVEYEQNLSEQWRCANATTLISETAGELARETGIGCCWFEDGTGKRVYSLRSNADGLNVDVSEIAKRFGGGGHRNAAGFTRQPGQSHPWVRSTVKAE